MPEADNLVHLSGYATLGLVLATADWASPLTVLFVLPLVVGAVGYGGWLLYDHARARGELAESGQRAEA